MARPASQAIAGFYATPKTQVPRIASLLKMGEYDDEVLDRLRLSVLDPCAGEGEAILDITRALVRQMAPAKARNFERHRAKNEESRAQERLRRVERAREEKKRAEEKLVSAKIATFYSVSEKRQEKMRAKAVFRAEGALSRAERELTSALVAAGLAEAVPVVAEVVPPPVDPDDGDDVDDVDEEEDLDEEDPEESTTEDATKAVVEEEEADEKMEADVDADIYTCEMERGRYEILSKRDGFSWRNQQRALHGDAFCVDFVPVKDSGVGLAFLNPPYDTDKVHGRTEQKFLLRFTAALAPGGVLVFVVPHYALSASAETFARSYEDVSCYRFAGSDFATYKQVVVFAKKLTSDRLEPDAAIRDTVNKWAVDGDKCPELPEGDHRRPKYVVPAHSSNHSDVLNNWKMKPVDATAILAKFKPWHETTRRSGLAPLSRVVPSFHLVDVMHRTYEVATPPRPAHIAAGLAAGLFNGQRIEPDDPSSKLPSLLMKGVFDREWKTVEEKKDKHGTTKSVVQVQQPKLVITILDLKEHKYHTLGATLDESKSETVAGMGITDILKNYGKSLMDVMERQCVILYDPRYNGDDVVVADSPRKLYVAQEHAVKAMVKFLREKSGEHVLCSAEIGSGKSTLSLMTAKTMGAKRILVLCPPHLLDSWRNEAKIVVPEAEYRVVDSISSVDALWDVSADKMLVAVLSREVAKLSHRLESVSGRCPGCGNLLAIGYDYTKKRERCEWQSVIPENDYARGALELAVFLRSHLSPDEHRYLPLHLRPEGLAVRRAEHNLPTVERPAFNGLPSAMVRAVCEKIVEDCKDNHAHDSPVKKALVWALVAGNVSPEEILEVARAVKSKHYDYSHFVESILLLLPPGGVLGQAFAFLETFEKPGYGGEPPADWFKKQYAVLSKAAGNVEEDTDEDGSYQPQGSRSVMVGGLPLGKDADGRLTVAGAACGSIKAASHFMRVIGSLGVFSRGKPCGEPLYQSTPEPRRYPLAKYIVRKHKDTFDFVIADEIQEYTNDASAQTIAAHRLVALRKPMIFMTGTVMNGYAKSLHTTMTAISSDFRSEFDRDDLSAFVDRYGYRKRILADKEDGEIVAFGTQSDRVERSERDAGDAPGVLPLFLFRHLLASTVTLHKADLRINLPALTQDREVVAPTQDMQAEYHRMLEALKKQIKADMFTPGLAGRLFGQLGQLPSWLDCCTDDVGNVDGGGSFEIRYPENMPLEGYSDRLVVAGKMFPASTILPKEEKMLTFVEAEVAAGRNVMVLGWHIRLLPRLARLLTERLGETVPVLYADKVTTGKRQSWIEKEVVGKRRKCLVLNPVCVQTGLNALTHFASQWWHEDPACNPLTFRQAVGRIDRIGQKLPTKTLFGYYGETLQEKIYDLLMAKAGISIAVDGLDPTAAWQAAGIVEDEHLLGLSIGKALWEMMTRDEGSNVVPIRSAGRGGRK